MAGIVLKGQGGFISIMVPLEMLVQRGKRSEKRLTPELLKVDMCRLPLYSLGKIPLILCLKLLVIDFSSDGRLFHVSDAR